MFKIFDPKTCAPISYTNVLQSSPLRVHMGVRDQMKSDLGWLRDTWKGDGGMPTVMDV